MAKYVLAYRGGAIAETEAEQQAAMATWVAWFTDLGPAVVDAGNPFVVSATVNGSGVTPNGVSELTGYSIVTADSIDAAAQLAASCPVIAGGGAVDVYEALDIM